jgi:DNA-directed RNA polymerase subunit M/transcription elongation factor TFIIS
VTHFRPPMRFGCDTEPLDKCPLCEDKVLRSMMERHLQRKHKKSLDQVSSKAIDEVPRHQNEEPINAQSKQASPIVQEQAGGSASAPDTCSASAEPRAIPSDRRQASGHVVVKCDLCGAEVRADRLNRHKKRRHKGRTRNSRLKRAVTFWNQNGSSGDQVLCRLCGAKIPKQDIGKHIREFHGYTPTGKPAPAEPQRSGKRPFKPHVRIFQGGLPGLGKRR